MVNDTEKKQSTTSNKAQKPAKTVSPTQPSSKKRGRVLPLVALIAALGACTAAAYSLWINQTIHHQLKEEKTRLTQRFDNFKQEQAQVQNQFETTQEQRAALDKELQTRFDSLQEQLQTALAQRFYEQQDWKLLKARYYLELAQINTHWNQSLSTSSALLEQADRILAQLNETKVFQIRQAIAEEIAALKTTPVIDVVGILSQLDAAQRSIPQLTLPVSPEKTLAEQASEEKNQQADSWHKRLQNSVHLLEKLVIIRRHDEDIKPLLSPMYVSVLKENLRLNLQEAQWAVLNQNNDVYQIALSQALESLQAHFELNNATAKQLMDQLKKLQTISLKINKPEPGQSLPLLNQLINSKTSQGETPSEPQQGEQLP